jgi:hypothetical protein
MTGICGILALAASAQEREDGPLLPLRLTAIALDPSNVGSSQAGTLEITVERWSTDAERQRLLDALAEHGTSKLLSMLQKIRPRAASISAPGRLAWDIGYTQWQPGEDGGYRLVFASGRPMSLRELRANARSRDYEFMVCEIHMGANGVGEGTLAPVAKIAYDKKRTRLEIENYASQPVRLTEVRAR